MAARKRILKKRPEFRLMKDQQEQEEADLKKVKAQTLKDLEVNDKEWFDKELDKNLKKQ